MLRPTLTVAYHPDTRRIGEVARLSALLAGAPVAVSRREPDFQPVRGGAAAPLADPFLSRQPFTLSVDGDGLRLSCPHGGSQVSVDGAPVAGEHVVSAATLDLGVVLEVAERVVLLLHREPLSETVPPAMGLVGESHALQALRAEIARVADLDVSVLIRGETGSGKELVARAVHAQGGRRTQPFLAINMAAVAPTLAASELFGHVRGAFSGASQDRDALLARADRGTLFMDEVGDTPPAVQAMLLRLIETGESTPVGGTRARRHDVRIVAATDAPLEADGDPGGFRVQLLYRLAGYEISVPPLRERRDDVVRLFIHFLAAQLAELGQPERLHLPDPYADPWLPPALCRRLLAHDWPGNVRELRHLAGRIAIASQDGELRVPAGALGAETPGGAPPTDATTAPATGSRPRYRKPDDVGESELIAALRASGWAMTEAARLLNVSRTTLYALVESCAAVRKASDIGDAELATAWRECAGDAKEMAAHLEVSPRGLSLRLRQFEPPS